MGVNRECGPLALNMEHRLRLSPVLCCVQFGFYHDDVPCDKITITAAKNLADLFASRVVDSYNGTNENGDRYQRAAGGSAG